MTKYILYPILSVCLCFVSCLKKNTELPELDNFFDLNHEVGVWFEETAIDSFHWGAGTYYHHLHFNFTSEELKDVPLDKYRIMVKRNWKDEFDYVSHTSEGFTILAKTPDWLYGKITFDLGVRSIETGGLYRIYTHISQF